MTLHITAAQAIAVNSPAMRAALAAAARDGDCVTVDFAPEPLRIARPGLGDRLAVFLHRLGFRRGKSCGCARRQAFLNILGFRLQNILQKVKVSR